MVTKGGLGAPVKLGNWFQQIGGSASSSIVIGSFCNCSFSCFLSFPPSSSCVVAGEYIVLYMFLRFSVLLLLSRNSTGVSSFCGRTKKFLIFAN